MAVALADAEPDVQFMVDHCGDPEISAEAQHLWRENIVELARRPNVAKKISGFITIADPEKGQLRTCGPMSTT